jgi:hypothetical protein
MISDEAATQFLMMISETVGDVFDVESMRHTWKQFR